MQVFLNLFYENFQYEYIITIRGLLIHLFLIP